MASVSDRPCGEIGMRCAKMFSAIAQNWGTATDDGMEWKQSGRTIVISFVIFIYLARVFAQQVPSI